MGPGLPGLLSLHLSLICAQAYKGNFERILQSIAIAKSHGATLRVGPELEIPLVWRSSSRVLPE